MSESGQSRALLLVALGAGVATALSLLTNLVSALIPTSWISEHAALVWALTGVFAVATVVLAVVAARRSRVGASAAPVPISAHPLPEAGAPVPRLVGDLPGESPSFVKRAAVSELTASFDGVATPAVRVLYGRGGLGKTQAAAAYARASLSNGCPLVVWIAAHSQEQLLTDMTKVAADLGVADPEGDSAKSARRVHGLLQNRVELCVVIFDNVNDPDAVKPYLPRVGNCRVVLTTIEASVMPLGRSVPIDVFGPDQAVEFMLSRTGVTDPTGAAELAEDLERLPLALGQAAAVIAERRYSFARYRTLLADQPIDAMLPRHAGQDYPRSLAAAVLLTLASLIDRDAATEGLGLDLALLSPEGVSRDLLTRLLGDEHTPVEMDEALGLLAGASLAAWSEDGTRISMHRLTARVVRERSRTLGQLSGAIDQLVAAVDRAADEFARTSATRFELREAAGHALPLALTAVRDSSVVSVAVMQRAVIAASNSIRRLFLAGDVTSAIELGESLAAAIKLNLPGERIVAGHVANNLAGAYESAGDLGRAIPLYQQTLADRDRVLGADHSDTLTSLNNLAYAYQSAGDLRRAIPMFEQTLADRKRVLGPDHPDTLTSLNNLAYAYQSAGDLRRAIPMFEQTLADRKRVLGPDHPDTLTSLNNLAYAYQSIGDLGRAIPMFEQTFTERERVLGPDHPDTLTARDDLAFAYRSIGDLSQAIPLFEQTLIDRERVLGPDHPDTLASRIDVAGAFKSVGDLGQAIPLFELAITDCERVFGPDHPNTLTSRNNLARGYQAAGDFSRAIPLYKRTLRDRERILVPDHPDTLTSRNDLAGAYQAAGDLDLAIPLFEAALSDRERVLGADHPDTLTSRKDLAGAYQAEGDLDRAVRLFEQTIGDADRVFGQHHPFTKSVQDGLDEARGVGPDSRA